jgi:hypothetical protein
MLDPQREIQALVDTFVADLSQLAKRIAIEQIKAAFELGAPSLPPYTATASAPASAPTFQLTSPSPAPARRGRRPRNESADVEGLRHKLVAAITQTPGQRTEDINAALGTETPQIAPVLRKLVAEQHVRTEGARRGTRYFVNASPEAMTGGGQPAASGGEQTA